MNLPSAHRVAAAYSFGPEWQKFVEWVQKKYPRVSFVLQNRPYGNGSIQELLVGSTLVASIWGINYTLDGAAYTTTVFGDSQKHVYVESNAKVPTKFVTLKAAFEKNLKDSPILLSKLNSKDLHPEYATKLKEAWEAIDASVREVIKVPIERFGKGSVESADIWLNYTVKDTYHLNPVLNVTIDYKSRIFKVSSFGASFSSGTFPGFITLINKIPQIIKKGLSGLPPHEVAALTGTVTSETLVSKILDVTASFRRLDEWFDTDLSISLMLSTSKPVASRLLFKWVLDHWSEVLRLAPSQAKTYTPKFGEDYAEGWIVPNQMPRPAASEMSVTQDGKVAIVVATATQR